MPSPEPPHESAIPPGIPAEGEIVGGGRYRIEHLLGIGGMGIVLAARHLQLGQPLAIKILHPKIAKDTVAVARFVREAQAAVNIQSEHVARVLDVGALDNGLPYMVMERLNGRDLGEIVHQYGPLPVHAAAGYLLQACEAIAEAHQKGIVHRDLKPSNLFLGQRSDGSPLIKVLDFGIAKVTEAENNVRLTSTGTGMGSPQYMSPEQVRDAGKVDARADVWALGVTLFELLSDQAPFSGTTYSALCAQIIADEPLALRKLRPDAPEAIEALIQRCLQKKPDRRFADIGELAHALAAFAPRGAEVSVERIAGTLGRRSLAEQPGRPPLASGGRADALTGALSTTVARTEAARVTSTRRAALLGVGAGALLVVTAGVVLLGVFSRGRASPAATADSAAPPALSASAPASAAVAVAPQVTVSAAPPASSAAPPPVRPLPLGGSLPPGGPLPPRKSADPTTAKPPPVKGAPPVDPLDDRK
jgi:serine/threonine-protein kinase